MHSTEEPSAVMENNHSRSAIICVLIFCVTQVLCVYLYTQRTRFEITQSGHRAYRIDRTTGDVWEIVNGSYNPVTGPVNFSR